MNGALRILNAGDRYYSALIIQRLEDDGRACSRPRQWKHGHERARLTIKTQKVLSWLQKIRCTIWKRHPVSNFDILQGLGARASLPALSRQKVYSVSKATLLKRCEQDACAPRFCAPKSLT